jgi:hypothetical protein
MRPFYAWTHLLVIKTQKKRTKKIDFQCVAMNYNVSEVATAVYALEKNNTIGERMGRMKTDFFLLPMHGFFANRLHPPFKFLLSLKINYFFSFI